jgi:hypothetical protein
MSLFNEVCDAPPFGVDVPEPLEGWFPILLLFVRKKLVKAVMY